jgi:hypothetical protein
MFGSIKTESGRQIYAGPIATKAAALAATSAVVLLGGAILLSGSGKSMADAPAHFSDRFSFATLKRDCPTSGWPYFKAECLRMADGSHARPVRIIAIDRPVTDGRMAALAN